MKILAWIAIVLASVSVALLTSRFATSFTGFPLGHHGMEATPATLVVMFSVFFLTLAISLLLGRVTINRLLTPKD